MRNVGLAALVSILFTTVLFAQNNRSAVSLTGNDAATCTVPDPCRTFNTAMAKTNAGGEVIVLSSAGYGPFTVTKSVSIISPPAYHAALAPTSGDAITITADNAVIVLRGLTLNGSLGASTGIDFTGAATISNSSVFVENCVITGFVTGISFTRNGELFILDTIIRTSDIGMIVDGAAAPSLATIDNVRIEKSALGIVVDNARVAVRNTVVSEPGNTGNSFWARANMAGTTAELYASNCLARGPRFANTDGFVAGAAAGTAILNVSNSVSVDNNLSGIVAYANGTVRAGNNTVTANGFGLKNSGGTFESAGNNNVRGNTTEVSGTITAYSTQ